MASRHNLVTSRSNQRVKQLRAALTGNLRPSNGWVGIEGEHLVTEALRSGLALQTVFLAEGTSAPSHLPPETEVLHLARSVFASAVSTESPQGIAALLVPTKPTRPRTGSPLLLIAVGLQDPGNLGTLLRSAEAFGAASVLLTPGTVSPWNQKAMRASAGSVFRVPTENCSLAQIVALKHQGIRLLAAVATGGEAPDRLDLRSSCALMIGNEGAGLGPEWLELADARVTLRCPGPVESLNAAVAGSLLLYEASRQRHTTPGAGTP
jgi:TrmH family RNA methyltransferase